MDLKQISSFVKIEHTLFSLPFVFIGAFMAGSPSVMQLVWILVAAVGARGLAMGLNRIIDRDIDAVNPRTEGRHLASGSMSLQTAWILCGVFLTMLLIGAWKLNPLALKLSWIPVLAFVIYPYMKRFTWACHWWLGLCLGLAPAGAWVGITGEISSLSWWPGLFLISLGVAFWIATFDINYALMDIESDRENGIKSFPVRFGEIHTERTSVQMTLLWFACFAISDPIDEVTFLVAAGLMALVNIAVLLRRKHLVDFQKTFFRTSVLTGWVLLAGLIAGQQLY
jgi:4-hydroxybenzoate polyprenyltransferase